MLLGRGGVALVRFPAPCSCVGIQSPMTQTAKTFRGPRPLFLFSVVLPTLVAIVYFGLVASNVYVSESRFLVRSPEKAAPTAFGALLNNSGLAHATTESAAAQSYVLSRDALRAINRDEAFRKAYTAPHISLVDRFDPLGIDSSFEALYRYYEGKVRVDTDNASSISVVTVRAYSPRAAHDFNEALLRMAEATVNRMSERGRQDLIAFAQAEVVDAKNAAQQTTSALADYRNRKGVVDPEKQATIQLEMVSKLQDDLVATRSQLLELRAVAPQSPQIPVLEARAKGLQREIDEKTGAVAGSRGSLAASAAQYTRLQLDNEFAGKRLAAALASLTEAENEARRKHAYVERIAEPNLPDEAIEPRRIRGVLTTLVFSLVVWGVLAMLIAGVREHRS